MAPSLNLLTSSLRFEDWNNIPSQQNGDISGALKHCYQWKVNLYIHWLCSETHDVCNKRQEGEQTKLKKKPEKEQKKHPATSIRTIRHTEPQPFLFHIARLGICSLLCISQLSDSYLLLHVFIFFLLYFNGCTPFLSTRIFLYVWHGRHWMSRFPITRLGREAERHF